MKAALAAFGADPEMIAEAIKAQRLQEFPLWPQNEAPMNVLIAMRSQLRRFGLNGRVDGLDYSALPWVMQRVGIPSEDIDDVFFRVQCAEDELVACYNEN